MIRSRRIASGIPMNNKNNDTTTLLQSGSFYRRKKVMVKIKMQYLIKIAEEIIKALKRIIITK